MKTAIECLDEVRGQIYAVPGVSRTDVDRMGRALWMMLTCCGDCIDENGDEYSKTAARILNGTDKGDGDDVV